MIQKFRVWDKETDTMHDVSGIDFDDGEVTSVSIWSEGWPWILDPENIELMQFTGVKDRNGVEIYEGDAFIKIFRTMEIPTGKNGVEKAVGIVKMHKGSYQVYIDGWGYDLLSDVMKLHTITANSDYWENEIVGNIYENPELIKVG